MNKYFKFFVTFSSLLINTKGYTVEPVQSPDTYKELILKQILEIEEVQTDENIILLTSSEIAEIEKRLENNYLNLEELTKLTIELENVLDRRTGTDCVC